jgi:hypothetical protein
MFRKIKSEDLLDQQKPADPFRALRGRQRPTELESSAITWIAKLPREVQPRELGRQYPRIVNKLAQLWGNGSQVDNYLNELVGDTRGSRSGFPKPVRDELLLLRSHCRRIYVTSANDGWAHERLLK